MKILFILGSIATAIGLLMILFSKSLGAVYEGGQATMSDLGFIAYGMILGLAGILLLVAWVIMRLVKRH